ncbi:MAG: hypothetical protein H7A51_04725 [Akkermansiaceae bacterium]|nr:hypothetical protein [Akkermansiaceae bacterium]
MMLACGVILLGSCDKLPFIGGKKETQKPDAIETPAPKEEAQARSENGAAAGGGPLAKPGAGTPDLQAGEHILYRSPQPLPVGTVLLTTVSETHQSKTSYDAGDQKPAQVTESVTDKLKVFGRVIDSDQQITLYVKTDQSEKAIQSSAPQKTMNPLHGKVAVITKEGETWNIRLKSGEASQAEQQGLDEFLIDYNTPDDLILYGVVPRKVGDVWCVDPTQIPSFQKPGYQVQSGSSCKVRFKEVINHQGHPYALLETELDIHVLITEPSSTNTTETGSVKAEIKAKGKNLAYRSLVYGLNLSEQVHLSITTKRIAPNKNGYGVALSTGSITENTVTELELQKPSQPVPGLK